jgi:hypothetical protein
MQPRADGLSKGRNGREIYGFWVAIATLVMLGSVERSKWRRHIILLQLVRCTKPFLPLFFKIQEFFFERMWSLLVN